MERLEGSFFGFDDSELFYQVWRPEENSRGSLIITHGMAEHSECYHALATELVQDQWTVYAWDLRGHGRSEGKRGFVRDFSDYRKDLSCFIDYLKSIETTNERPRFLIGHSMGGLIQLQLMIDNPPQGFKAFVCSSPALGLSIKIPNFKRSGAEFLAKWAPRMTMFNEIKYQDLHRDPELLKEYEADPLRHDKISPGLFVGMLQAMDEVKAKAGEIHQNIMFQLAGNERICDSAISSEVFENIASKNKKIIIYPDSLHEIYNDEDRDQVIHDLKFYLQENEG